MNQLPRKLDFGAILNRDDRAPSCAKRRRVEGCERRRTDASRGLANGQRRLARVRSRQPRRGLPGAGHRSRPAAAGNTRAQVSKGSASLPQDVGQVWARV
jgi:hypothetical protein